MDIVSRLVRFFEVGLVLLFVVIFVVLVLLIVAGFVVEDSVAYFTQ